jgi:hypothetical protein
MFVVQTMFLFIHAGNVFPRGGVLKDVMLDESYITLNRWEGNKSQNGSWMMTLWRCVRS